MAIYASVALVIVLVFFGVILFYDGETYKYEIELVRSPVELVKVFLNTVYQMGPFWVESFAGYNLGALSINAWLPCFWAYGIVLALSLIVNLGETVEFKRGEKLFISVLVVAIVVAITLVFRTWSGTHDGRWDIIMGVQGRYFIPLVILLLLSAMSLKRTVRSDTCVATYATVIAFIFVLDALTIIRSF